MGVFSRDYSISLHGEVVKPGTMEMEMEMEMENKNGNENGNGNGNENANSPSVPQLLTVLAPLKLQSPLNFATILYKARQTRFIFAHHDQHPLPLRPAALTLIIVF